MTVTQWRGTRSAAVVVAVVVAFAPGARLPAQPPAARDTAAADPCPGSQTQLALNLCADSAARRADAALSAEYRRVLAQTADARRPLLRRAQRGWLAYRDAYCAFVASESEGGSVYPMQLRLGRARVTDRRTAELRRDLADDAH